jgi:hypothetical protein
MTPEPIEVWFKIEKDAEGYPVSQDWEELWASPVEAGFRLDSTPFFVKDIATGDVVSAVKTEEGYYRFDRIVSRSGNSNFRIWLHDAAVHEREEIAAVLRGLGCHVETTLERLIAIDVPARCESAAWEYLRAGVSRDDWGLRVGFSPD